MQENTTFRLSVLTASMAAMFSPALYAASAGQVEFASSGVNAIGPNGQSRPLAKGAEVQPGETIDTGTGRAQLRFTDGGYVSLQPQTQFRLEQYGYDKDDPKKNGIVMNLLKGGLRTITGLIGKTNREGYKLQTATATVGIRGTEFSITGFPDGSIVFHTTDGAIDVSNNTGSTTVNGGQSVSVNSTNSAPTKTDEKPFLPPAVSLAQTQIPAVNQNDSTTASNPVTTTTTAAPLLTGTFTGQWRAVTGTYSYGYGTANIKTVRSGYAGTFTVAPSGHATSLGYSFSPTSTSTSLSFNLGSASAQSYGNDGVMAWGRWTGTGSTVTSGNSTSSPNYSAFPLHYVVGQPLTDMPTTGSATYNMYGATAPSCGGPACGAISLGGSLNINFGTMEGSYTLNVANSADNVKLSGTNSIYLTNTGTFAGGGIMNAVSGSAAVGNASSNIDGFLAGKGATHAGAAYSVNYSALSASGGTLIYGAAVYKQ
jgi:hypothetical protein